LAVAAHEPCAPRACLHVVSVFSASSALSCHVVKSLLANRLKETGANVLGKKMLIKTTGWRFAAVALVAMAVLGVTVPNAAAANSLVSLDCPLLAGSAVTAQYYENGAATCGQLRLQVTAPDGSVQSFSPSSCKDGAHAFPRYGARERGGYAIKAIAPQAEANCSAVGVAIERRRVPELNPLAAIAVGLAAVLLARRHGL